jgi:signal transduction histidine kinase
MVRKISSFVQYFLSAGIVEGISYASQRKRIVFNRLNFFSFFVTFFWMLLLFFVLDFNSQKSVLLVNSLPFVCTIITAILMLNHKDRAAIHFSLIVYPPLIFVLSWITAQPVILNYIFIFCLMAFFFLNNITKIVLFFIYYTVFYTAGVVITHLRQPELLLEVYVEVTVFALIYITGYTIKKEVGKYELELKKLNANLDEKNQELHIQKKITDAQAISLQQKSVALAELNELKTKIFSNVSNELSDHVYFADTLLKEIEKKEDAHHYLMQMLPHLRYRADNSVQVIERVLSWSKTLMQLSTPKPQLLDMGHLVKAITSIAQRMAKARDIDLLVKTEKGLNAFVDRDMMEIALRNIVDNTINSAKPGSTIGINALRKDFTILLQVIDFGPNPSSGITVAEEIVLNGNSSQALVKELETGIGMALSKELVEKNQGSFQQQYWEDMGSISLVSLPLSDISFAG